MKKLFLLLFFLPVYILAQDTTGLIRYIDSLTAPLNKIDVPGAVLLVAKDGKSIYRKAYGMVSLELGVPARPDHLFAIASVSKQFTGVAMLQLVNRGKLKLEDDIRKFLPDFNTHGQTITIEDLFTHTSGISSTEQKDYLDFVYSHGIYSNDEFLHYATKPELLFTPNSDWSYNNFGYVLAAIIIEKMSGISFSEYMDKNIFQPAGMTNTYVADERHGLKNVATSYYRDSDGKWMHHYPRLWFWAKGAGNLISCIDDMLKWDIALREEKLLPRALLEKAWTAHILKDGRSTNYGFGWAIAKNNTFRFIEHDGVIYGYRTTSLHVPEKNLYLLCANFSGNSEEPRTLIKKIVSRVLPVSYPSAAKTDMPLSDYTGVYKIHRMGGVAARISDQIADVPVYVNITLDNDTLYMQPTAGEKVPLRPAGKDKFLPATSENTWYIFTRDASGKVNAISAGGSFWSYGPEVKNMRVNIQWPSAVDTKTFSPGLLKKFAGTYYRSNVFGGDYFFIETDDNKLFNKFQGNRQELIPVSDNKFVRKGAEDISFEFKPGKNGALVLTVSGLRSYDYRKIE